MSHASIAFPFGVGKNGGNVPHVAHRAGRSVMDVANVIDRDFQCVGGDLCEHGLHTLANRKDGKKWTPLLKPWPLRPAVPGGFTIDDFTHDPDARTLTCPAGVTRPLSPKNNVTFGIAYDYKTWPPWLAAVVAIAIGGWLVRMAWPSVTAAWDRAQETARGKGLAV